MKDDELLAKLCPESIAILQAAITPRIDTADITRFPEHGQQRRGAALRNNLTGC
jgi:hypothetical protein